MLHPVFVFPDGIEFIFPYCASKQDDPFYAKLESEEIQFECMREYWDGENFTTTNKYVVFDADELKALPNKLLEIPIINNLVRSVNICMIEKDLQTAA